MTSPSWKGSARISTLTVLLALRLCAQANPQETAQEAAPFDIVISGGRIVDGTGSPWFLGDVGLRGDVIAAVGDLDGAAAKKRIDAKGLVPFKCAVRLPGRSINPPPSRDVPDNRTASRLG